MSSEPPDSQRKRKSSSEALAAQRAWFSQAAVRVAGALATIESALAGTAAGPRLLADLQDTLQLPEELVDGARDPIQRMKWLSIELLNSLERTKKAVASKEAGSPQRSGPPSADDAQLLMPWGSDERPAARGTGQTARPRPQETQPEGPPSAAESNPSGCETWDDVRCQSCGAIGQLTVTSRETEDGVIQKLERRTHCKCLVTAENTDVVPTRQKPTLRVIDGGATESRGTTTEFTGGEPAKEKAEPE